MQIKVLDLPFSFQNLSIQIFYLMTKKGKNASGGLKTLFITVGLALSCGRFCW